MQSVQTGPYGIYNCGARTSTVSLLVNTLITTLEPALKDVTRSTSSNTFNAFFKHITFASTVYDILFDIFTGTAVPPGPYAMRDATAEYFGPAVTPRFICVTDYNQVTWSIAPGGQGGPQRDAHTVCQQSPVNSFGIFGSKYLNNSIILCPNFFTYTALPTTSAAGCLTVDPHFNRFRDSGKRLVNYQLWVILHELAHVYIYARSGSLLEISTANDCFLLAGGIAVDNAQNYVYYVASKFMSPFRLNFSVRYFIVSSY